MLATILTVLALQSDAALAATPSPQADVVVTGRRLNDALASCIARGCPPEEEVEAAMSASTESFHAGRYEEAMRTLRRAVLRNKRFAARMPGKMSDLYATYADVAEHEGDMDAFRVAQTASVAVLRDHAGKGSPAALGAAVRLGDMYAVQGLYDEADDAFRRASEAAAKHGQTRIAGMLSLKRVALAFGTKEWRLARDVLDKTEREFGSDAAVGQQVGMLRLRLAMRDGNDAAAEALLAKLRATPTATPVLLSAPPYPMIASAASNGINPDGSRNQFDTRSSGMEDIGDYRWADIGFWVRPDGRTQDAQVLRASKGSNWAEPLLGHVAQRRYAPLAGDGGSPGSYRIERYTLRPVWQQPTGSRILKRMGQETLHVVDLTGSNDARTAGEKVKPIPGV